MSEKRCYTVQELQEILGVSRPTIYNLLKKKEFRWIQLDGGKYRIPLPWKSDEEALKDFWDYCEERQREERIIAEMKIKGCEVSAFGKSMW